jgi:hypothetical protein
MELDTESVQQFERFPAFYNIGHSIGNELNRNIEEYMGSAVSDHFRQRVKEHKYTYPVFEEKFTALNTRLYDLTLEQKRDLKSTLQEEMRSLRVKMELEMDCRKVLLGEELPTDHDECLLKIGEMHREACEQMEEIKKRIAIISSAKLIITTVRDNKAAFNPLTYREDFLAQEPKKKRGRNV